MTMINLKYAETHTALFLAGTNLGLRLNIQPSTPGHNRPGYRAGLVLVYDRAEKELLVTYNGETAIVPTTNVVSMVAGEVQEVKIENPPVPAGKIEPQVSTPMSHVFAGPGGGKTGKDK